METRPFVGRPCGIWSGLRHERVSRATRSAPFLAFVLRDPRLHQFLNKRSRQWLVRGEVDFPLDVEKPLSSFLNASITDEPGNKLQCFENAANHTSTPLCLNAGIR